MKRLEILKLSDSCNIVGILNFLNFLYLTFWRISIILFSLVRLGLVKHWLAQSPKFIHSNTPVIFLSKNFHHYIFENLHFFKTGPSLKFWLEYWPLIGKNVLILVSDWSRHQYWSLIFKGEINDFQLSTISSPNLT